MKITKTKITKAVEDYIKTNPVEYKAFLKAMRVKDELSKSDTGIRESVQRHLYDLPEILHYMIKSSLEEEEWGWFKSLDDYQNNHEASEWFIKTFPQFSSNNK